MNIVYRGKIKNRKKTKKKLKLKKTYQMKFLSGELKNPSNLYIISIG